ncbi:MAG TPA: hypothetical protein PKN33_21105 [Phycisphaerae bacterium]|nr:hypothetical protein [Phycisphaerae bacterium]
MGYSIQCVGQNWLRARDSDLRLLMRMMVVQMADLRASFPHLQAFAESWDMQALYPTPGCIRLELDSIACDRLMVSDFIRLIRMIRCEIMKYGPVLDASTINRRWPVRGGEWGDEDACKLISLLDAIEALVTGKPLVETCESKQWWASGSRD